MTLATAMEHHSELRDSTAWDIVVYGSTSSAVTSAIQASRCGRSVVLISPLLHIGGIQVEGLGATDIDGQPDFQNSTTLGGLPLEFHKRISAHYGRSERLQEVLQNRIKDPNVWRFESHVAERIINEWLQESTNLSIIYSTLSEIEPCAKDGPRIQSLKLANGRIIRGKMFIEATYEGDLLAAASISTTLGREPRSAFGESFAGIREHTHFTSINVAIDPYKVPGNPASGLLFGISLEPCGCAGDSDMHLPAYSFRVPLTDRVENLYPIYKPEDYDPTRYELYRRFALAGGKLCTPLIRVPGRKTDIIGCEAALHTDLVGMHGSWPEGDPEHRKQILARATSFTKGLLYFYTADDSLPVGKA